MTIQSLVYAEPGKVEWREVPTPRLHGSHEALVAPVAASRCDFDRFIVSGETPLQAPFAIGHEAVVRVVDVGDSVHAVSPGDLAVLIPTITCGRCGRCRRGLTAYCSQVPPGSAFGVGIGFGGLFDDLIRVPFAEAMLTVVRAELDPVALAPVGDSISLGRTIMSSALAAGATRVGVFGRGEHGLYQVAFAHLLVRPEVLWYIDADPERRSIAETLGATTVAESPYSVSGPLDLLVDASANPAWLQHAVNLVEPDGVIECLGGYFADIALPGFAMYLAGTQIRFGQGSTARHIKPTVEVIIDGHLKPASVWATQVDWADLPDAYLSTSGKLIASRPYT